MDDDNDDGTPGDTEVEPGDQEVVQPEDESQTVPLKQFKAALSSAETKREAEVAALQRQIDELKARPAAQAPAAQAPKTYTRGELKAFVDAGQLTQDQADTVWDRQLEAKITQQVAERVDQTVAARERGTSVQSDIAGYRELVPEAWSAGSEQRAKVEEELKNLLRLGFKHTEETEVVALRAAFGPLSTLRKAKGARPGPSESHAETGGGRPGGDKPGKDKDLVKALPSDRRDWYAMKIKQGIYKGWDQVREELKFAGQRRTRPASGG